jgi:2-oxoglutarate decarboxylase
VDASDRGVEGDDFGPNDWLIDEMYRLYLDNPQSVSEAWRDFFSDYRPPGAEPVSSAPVETPARDDAREAPVTAATPKERAPPEKAKPAPDAETVELKGADRVIAERMSESLGVPTATSVRVIPARLLEVNRNIVNRYLARGRGGKVSFTHLIAYAVVRALADHPAMNVTFDQKDGRPVAVRHKRVNLGLAVDIKRKDGSRTLLVPNLKDAETLEFARFFSAYEELIRKTHSGKLSPDDFAGTTVTITNPGTLGTVQSVPRLMAEQAAIIGVGAIGYPAEYQAADPQTLAETGVGKVITLTSTYDHRVIQGAESGEFLGRIHELLLGEDGFYEEVFRSLHVPYVPARWHADVNPPVDSTEATQKHARVLQMINMYRVRGHLIADLDPLETKPPTMHPELDPNTYGLTIWDLDRRFVTGGLAGKAEMRLGDILGVLRDAYCRTSTVEYMHIQEPDQKQWIQDQVEGVSAEVSAEDQRHVLGKLIEAEAFETFLHQKYVGHKRFSLEGAESMIPMLDTVLNGAADDGLDEAVIGMTHRGRLNVLATVIGKSYSQIFKEFEGDIDPNTAQGSGDVKYHLGAFGKHTSRAGKTIAVSVASNPSHLESVDPVVEGIARAKQDISGRPEEAPVLPLLIHGDAAFAGQGVVAETLNLSQLSGFRTGGTIHIVVNNQLGFTTGSDYGRSSTYATDVARMVQAPIFHVNGDDPEACVRVATLAYEFRQKFRKDVVIDMWCYRRWGHNEADEPSFTQPLMYARIKDRRSVRKLYTERLVNRGDLSVEEAERSFEEFRSRLQEAFDQVPHDQKPPKVERRKPRKAETRRVETAAKREILDRVLEGVTTVPDGFNLHPKIARWLEERSHALEKDAVEWSLGEALAFGSLLLEGVTVRLSGQDSRRGTFSQRHAALVDQRTGEEYLPLANLSGDQGRFLAYDSLLSEFAALGFEYGYSIGDPAALVIWEAQFGDFVNGAQVVTDEFISAAEDKWVQSNRLVLLLPHGFEGQGPDHSSARLERFLQLSAEDNWQVVVPTTPAQYFHLLRRQAVQEIAKPLVVMTPKSLLRLPEARSAAREFTEEAFQEVLGDPSLPDRAKRILLCQGKVFYDLARHRDEKEVEGAAVIRVEQLYPLRLDLLRETASAVEGAEIYWVQEEPENMGAWTFVDHHLRREGWEMTLVAREESASPATGSNRLHQAEQQELVERAFEGL